MKRTNKYGITYFIGESGVLVDYVDGFGFAFDDETEALVKLGQRLDDLNRQDLDKYVAQMLHKLPGVSN